MVFIFVKYVFLCYFKYVLSVDVKGVILYVNGISWFVDFEIEWKYKVCSVFLNLGVMCCNEYRYWFEK